MAQAAIHEDLRNTAHGDLTSKQRDLSDSTNRNGDLTNKTYEDSYMIWLVGILDMYMYMYMYIYMYMPADSFPSHKKDHMMGGVGC